MYSLGTTHSFDTIRSLTQLLSFSHSDTITITFVTRACVFCVVYGSLLLVSSLTHFTWSHLLTDTLTHLFDTTHTLGTTHSCDTSRSLTQLLSLSLIQSTPVAYSLALRLFSHLTPHSYSTPRNHRSPLSRTTTLNCSLSQPLIILQTHWLTIVLIHLLCLLVSKL
jgi:hypothetical protein